MVQDAKRRKGAARYIWSYGNGGWLSLSLTVHVGFGFCAIFIVSNAGKPWWFQTQLASLKRKSHPISYWWIWFASCGKFHITFRLQKIYLYLQKRITKSPDTNPGNTVILTKKFRIIICGSEIGETHLSRKMIAEAYQHITAGTGCSVYGSNMHHVFQWSGNVPRLIHLAAACPDVRKIWCCFGYERWLGRLL